MSENNKYIMSQTTQKLTKILNSLNFFYAPFLLSMATTKILSRYFPEYIKLILISDIFKNLFFIIFFSLLFKFVIIGSIDFLQKSENSKN
jgi:hypothetical protein